jgi:hypothetical protein
LSDQGSPSRSGELRTLLLVAGKEGLLARVDIQRLAPTRASYACCFLVQEQHIHGDRQRTRNHSSPQSVGAFEERITTQIGGAANASSSTFPPRASGPPPYSSRPSQTRCEHRRPRPETNA